MNKHVLMLTAATVALMAGPAFGDTSITSKVTDAQVTSTTGNLDIGGGGSVVVTIANPAVEIDSANTVKLSTAGSQITNKGTASAIGVQLDAKSGGNGPGSSVAALDSYGVIDLTGSGTGKYGVLVKSIDGAGSVFNGGITLEAGSSLKVTGDASTGIEVATDSTMNGTVTILGSLTGTPSSTTSTTSGSVSGVRIDGTLNGNFSVGTAGVISTTGYGATGVVVNGPLNGSFTNNGTISASGTATVSSTATNPEAGSAVIIGNSVSGGIYNAGPLSTGSSTARASIVTGGVSPALLISPGAGGTAATSALNVSAYGTVGTQSYDLINRGNISGQALNANLSAVGVELSGSSSYGVTLNDGVFNAGTISASATTDLKGGNTTTAQAFVIGNYATVGRLDNNGIESGAGVIKASVSGTKAAEADALVINKDGTLTTLTNSGTISASATTTDTTISSLKAYAVKDLSGTLVNVTNAGTISAVATTLDNNAQTAVALDLSAATSGINFTNNGTVVGDVLLGSGNDTLNVAGSSTQAASITGNIAFNGGTGDVLYIGDYGSVSGQVTERGGGTVAVTVGSGGGTGTLNLTNTTAGLNVSNLTVRNGGTLNVTLSQAFNSTSSSYVGSIINATSTAAGTINLEANSNFGLNFGSFISTPGGVGTAEFVLLEAPNGNLTLSNYSTIKNTIEGTSTTASQIPYLFEGSICTYNVAGLNSCAAPSGTTAPTDSQLVLQLTPKTPTQIGLTGNSAKIFPYVNAALANDDPLGSAIISGVTDAASAQAAYSGFLPDLSGASRAVAVSLTDQATGPVGARQRALRMYAAQPGGTTMWGQEFVQRLNSGNNAEGYRASGFGFAVGADGGSPESGRYGAAFTFFSGDQTNKASNFTKTSNQWYMLTGYTDWRGKGLFLDSQLSVGYATLNGKRHLTLTDSSGTVLNRTARSKRAGLLVAGGLTTGAVFTYGGTVLIPQVSLDALTMREEGYTETGGGQGFNLKVQPYYANSMRGYIGTTVRQDIDLGGMYLQPEGRVGYRYDFLADPVKLKAAFASVGDQFSLTGPDPERGNLVAGASLAVTTDAWSLGLNYDYLRGTGGAVSQMGTLTLIGHL